jgi:DNA (cytosine-5)-methyltransferase 1
MNVTHYDLFAGIGVFSYALDTVFDGHTIEHIFCERAAFPAAVLRKHWPHARFFGDIADLIADTNWLRSVSQTGRGISRHAPDITILTGGFPCQPFSQAGRRRGTADDRYLWPAMLAVIRNVRPDWIIAENVRGLATWNEGLVLETVCADLEGEGYEVQPLVIPACAIGAPHRRDRVWIVAHAVNNGSGKAEPGGTGSPYSVPAELRQEDCATRQLERADRYRLSPRPSVTPDHAARWHLDWHEVAAAACHDRMDDGLPRWLDGHAISAARHRLERLKACGNAIVPQVAIKLFEAMLAN